MIHYEDYEDALCELGMSETEASNVFKYMEALIEIGIRCSILKID